MNPFQNNFNNPNKSRINAHNHNQYQLDPSNRSFRNPQHKSLNFDGDFNNQDLGFPSKNRDSNFKNFNSDRNPKTSSKGEFYDYEFDLMSEKSSSNNYQRKNNQFNNSNNRDNRNFSDIRNQSQNQNFMNSNPAFSRKNRINSDEELEIKMPFESFGNQKRSYQMEKSNYANPRNFGIPSANMSEASQANPEQKVNYKLQKKVKKGEVDDEVDIINSYAKENCRFLPIEEYCMVF